MERNNQLPKGSSRLKIAYLFTTFPVLSETFLQREIRAMQAQGVDFTIYSLWLGQRTFEGHAIRCFDFAKLFQVLWMLPYWMLRRPQALVSVFAALWSRRMPSLTNLGEVLLGIGFALVYANHFRREQPTLMHAVWATMPSTAALLLQDLVGIRFSMGAHAYDIYRHGGDWLLELKLQRAEFVHTTTQSAQRDLLSLGAKPDKVRVIRRGLHVLPEMKLWRAPQGCLSIVSVGRLIAKKGYDKQLAVYGALRDAGIAFRVQIAGEGPLREALQQQIDAMHLGEQVTLLGKQQADAVEALYRQADVFVFTGEVAPSGDRDGLPNVIPEAMAIGVPVITTPVAGTTEAIEHGVTGFCLPVEALAAWVEAFTLIWRHDARVKEQVQAARLWVEEHFDAHRNAKKLAACMQEVLGNS